MYRTSKPKTATFLMPNPMYPNVRFMGVETFRDVEDAQEAQRIADANGWELVCVKTKGA